MKRFYTIQMLISAVFILLVMTSMSYGQARETREVSDFTELSVSSAFVVEIRVGNKESLEIEVDEDFIEDVVTEVRNGRLVIKMRETRGRRNYRRMRESPRAYLTVKKLDRISASGAVSMKTEDPLKSDKMDIDLSGASVINLELDVDELYLEASGACVMTLGGRATDQLVKTSGACVYRADDLESKVADIRVTGAGSARVNVSDRLDVRASGASSVRYKGSPRINSSTSGASSVKRYN